MPGGAARPAACYRRRMQKGRKNLMSRLRRPPRLTHILIVFTLLVMAAVVIAQGPARAQSNQICFPETNQCISGRIREFWEQNGGAPGFGHPTTPPPAH